MDKKGISAEMMVVLLAFVIVAMILLAFSSRLKDLLIQDSDVETCRLSVLAQAQTKIAGKTIVPLECPRRLVKIFNDKAEINGKRSKYQYKQLTNEQVNEIAAEELRLCWYMMAEGKRDVFEQSYFFSEGKYYQCIICSEIEFDKEVGTKSYEGLTDYLKSKKLPKMDISYHDYLIRSQQNLYLLWGIVPWTQYTPWGYGTTKRDSFKDKFETNEKYLIYFLAHKPSWLVGLTGGYTSAYYIGLGNEEKLREECAILIN
ncbi:hypothetical protein J4234_00390 [Candidatus Woesearchaeota archaeon]|nr:hypothetical protein [Candidatus Woesearchaeota archaeon]